MTLQSMHCLAINFVTGRANKCVTLFKLPHLTGATSSAVKYGFKNLGFNNLGFNNLEFNNFIITTLTFNSACI